MVRIVLVGLLVAVVLAVLLSPFASRFPDGLERVAEDKGFIDKGEGNEVISSPIPDYAMPGVKHEGVATSLAGLVGTIFIFGLAYGLGHLLKGRRN